METLTSHKVAGSIRYCFISLHCKEKLEIIPTVYITDYNNENIDLSFKTNLIYHVIEYILKILHFVSLLL